MPNNENMKRTINGRKGLVLEGLLRLIVAGVIFSIVYFGVWQPTATIIFGEGSNLESFNRLIEDINKEEIGSREAVVYLPPNTAIIGFSKGRDYQCYGCGFSSKDKLEAQFKRPSNAECSDSTCVCICLKGLPNKRGSQQVLEITCEKLLCKSIVLDIYPKIELGDLIKKRYGRFDDTGFWYNLHASWQGGFLYARADKEISESMSGLPKNNQGKISMFIEKKGVGESEYVAVCPVAPCIKEQK